MSSIAVGRREFLRLAAAAAAAGLTEFDLRHFEAALAAAPARDAWIPTTCMMCGGSSGMLAHVVDGRVVKVEPNSANPAGTANISTDFEALKIGGARLCAKGNASIMSLYDPDRVKRPLKRLGERGSGRWQEIEYDQAVSEIAGRLASLNQTYGPQTLTWFTEDASFNAIQEDFCYAYGTPNFHNHSNICDVSRKVAFLHTAGADRPLADFRNTKYAMIFGWNPLGAMKWSHLPRIILDGLANGAKLVVVDPRCSETAEKALAYGGRWLPIKPGTDGALALAIAHVIIREGRHDSAFIANWTVGFDRFAELVSARPPEWAEPITGIRAETIRDVARELATTKPAIVDAWSGPGQHRNGTDGTRAVASLVGLIGQFDQSGTMIVPERKGPKYSVRPAPPIPRVDGRGTKYPFGHSSGIYVETRDAMVTGQPYPVKAAVFMFQNFVLSVPNTAKNLQALNNLELVVAVDTHVSETALMADYVIPGTHFLERWDVAPLWVTFQATSLRQPVVPPLFGQRAEYEFVADLARRMGMNDHAFVIPYEQYLDEALVAGMGIHLTDLQALPGATWIGTGTRYRKYETTGFGTPSKKFEFYSARMEAKGLNPLPDYTPTEDGPSEDYPLYVVNWKEALHTHSRTMNNRWLAELHGENEVWINPERASSLGIRDGDTVTIENGHGQASGRARVTARIRPDVVGMTHGFGHWGLGPVAKGKGINDGQFIPGKAEPISGQAAHKDGAVRVRR